MRIVARSRRPPRCLKRFVARRMFALLDVVVVHSSGTVSGQNAGGFSAQPRLNAAFTDSVLHVPVLWRHDSATGETA